MGQRLVDPDWQPEVFPWWSVEPYRGWEDCWGCGMPPAATYDDPFGPPRRFCEWCYELLAALSPTWARVIRYGGVAPLPDLPDPGIAERR